MRNNYILKKWDQSALLFEDVKLKYSVHFN